MDQLLSAGALVVLASQGEQVRSWLQGETREALVLDKKAPEVPALRFDGLTIDLRQHRVFWRGRLLTLSERELSILKTLAREPRRAWSFAELQREVWSSNYSGDKTLVKVAIQRLRRKLRAAGVSIAIEAVRGYGFRLTTD